MAKKTKKKMGKKSLSQVNEVPLSDFLQKAAAKLLRAVHDNEWSEGYGSGADFRGNHCVCLGSCISS